MSEKEPRPHGPSMFELLHLLMKLMQTKDNGQLHQIIRRIRDHRELSRVTAEQRAEGEEKAKQFAANFLDFLTVNIDETLAPLQLSETQKKLFNYLRLIVEEIPDNTGSISKLLQTGSELFLHHGSSNFPCLSVEFQTPAMQRDPLASFSAIWAVQTQLPQRAQICGYFDNQSAEAVHFLLFQKIPNEQEVLTAFGAHTASQASAQVVFRGQQIWVKVDEQFQGQHQHYQHKYALLGELTDQTGQKCFVYGCNTQHDTHRIVEPTSMREQKTVGAMQLF